MHYKLLYIEMRALINFMHNIRERLTMFENHIISFIYHFIKFLFIKKNGATHHKILIYHSNSSIHFLKINKPQEYYFNYKYKLKI